MAWINPDKGQVPARFHGMIALHLIQHAGDFVNSLGLRNFLQDLPEGLIGGLIFFTRRHPQRSACEARGFIGGACGERRSSKNIKKPHAMV